MLFASPPAAPALPAPAASTGHPQPQSAAQRCSTETPLTHNPLRKCTFGHSSAVCNAAASKKAGIVDSANALHLPPVCMCFSLIVLFLAGGRSVVSQEILGGWRGAEERIGLLLAVHKCTASGVAVCRLAAVIPAAEYCAMATHQANSWHQ